MAAAWGYLLAATYLAKLLPMYSGFSQPRARIRELWNWYLHSSAQRRDILDTLSLVNPGALMLTIGAVVLLDVALCAAVIAGLRRPEKESL
jgi:hypothetical protein